MLFTGREVRIGKNCARGLEYAILKTEDTVFPNSDRATLKDIISWDTVLKTPTPYPFAPLPLSMLFFARLNFASCKPTLRGDGEVATVPTNLSGSVGR